MKIGDLVRSTPANSGLIGTRVGIVVGMTEKKCWRTHKLGKRINWDIVDPEPHAVVSYPGPRLIEIPTVDLQVIDE